MISASLLLELQNISRKYNEAIVALNNISLKVKNGERIALLGPSGSGKSTLLSIIAGFEKPTTGEILHRGINIRQWEHKILLTRHIGFLFQSYHLLGHLDPLENVELALIPTMKSTRERRMRSEKLLTLVGLGHRLNSPVRNLSGGECQRVAFCRAIANRPTLLIADEPTGNLDTRSRDLLLSMLKNHHHNNGGSLLIATHDRKVASICQRIVHLEDGRILP